MSATQLLVKSGKVFTTGIGKAGVVAKRLAISLASASVVSQWVHGTEWVHGDLGALRSGDCVVAISHSGKTSELLSLATLLPARGVNLVAIVGDGASPVSVAARPQLHRGRGSDSGVRGSSLVLSSEVNVYSSTYVQAQLLWTAAVVCRHSKANCFLRALMFRICL